MIAGYFSAQGIPFVESRLSIPRLGIAGRVNFLVDTGATDTLLHPRDGSNLRIPFADLGNPTRRLGIGGTRTYYTESAVALFLDSSGEWQRFDVELRVSPPETDSDYLPSLLGRDVLNKVRMDYDFPERRLELEVTE